jgi:hypothetical protein
MTPDQNTTPADNTTPPGTPPTANLPGEARPASPPPADPTDDMKQRVDRLAGEQAPDITPEEFARLQRSGSLHIDAQGRVRANRREDTDPGVSLRKRRAWYGLWYA